MLPVVLANAGYKLGGNATTLTINGYGFDSSGGTNTVVLSNGAVVSGVTANSANLLTVDLSTSPTAGGTLTAVVITDGAAAAGAGSHSHSGRDD